MHDFDLRPLGVGEILDRSFGLFRQLFLPLIAIQVLAVGLLLPFQTYFAASGQQFTAPYFAMFLVGFLLSALASAATALLISSAYLGSAITPTRALRMAFPKVLPLLLLTISIGLIMVVSLLPAIMLMTVGMALVSRVQNGSGGLATATIAIVVGAALLALPFLVFAGLVVTTPALVLEDLGAGAALVRSWVLTKGNRGRAMGVLAVLVVVLMIPLFGLAAVGSLAAGGASQGAVVAVFTAVSSLASLVLTPLFYCALTLLYYDLRVRREAFDLEHLASAPALS